MRDYAPGWSRERCIEYLEVDIAKWEGISHPDLAVPAWRGCLQAVCAYYRAGVLTAEERDAYMRRLKA